MMRVCKEQVETFCLIHVVEELQRTGIRVDENT